jgi:hypothetical protein
MRLVHVPASSRHGSIIRRLPPISCDCMFLRIVIGRELQLEFLANSEVVPLVIDWEGVAPDKFFRVGFEHAAQRGRTGIAAQGGAEHSP